MFRQKTITGIAKLAGACALAIILLFVSSGCAKKVSFATSQVAPAARGTVKIKKDDNNNYRIQLSLRNLAEVKRLQPPKDVYVVWMVSGDNITKNLGKINSGSSMLSRKLKASFETVSPNKPVKIFITAENDAAIAYPYGQVILTTENF